jgi:hypothetical protein
VASDVYSTVSLDPPDYEILRSEGLKREDRIQLGMWTYVRSRIHDEYTIHDTVRSKPLGKSFRMCHYCN